MRWEFATPSWERDNLWSNFDPGSNSLVRATSGSLFNRTGIHPDLGDLGPRLGLAYSIDSKTSFRAGYGISYAFFNRPGSAEEGINGPLAVFGVDNQAFTPGGPVPAGFLTTQTGFNAGIASTFNPILSNNDYIPSNTKWPLIQSWVASIQHQLTKDTVLEVAYNGNLSNRLPILGDWNQAAPNAPGGTLGVQARRPDQHFGAITWVDPVGVNDYNGFSVRLEHHFSQGLYLLNSFTFGKAMGDSEQALEYYSASSVTGANPQNIQNLPIEYAPSSYDVKLIDVSSVVYNLPIGRGRMQRQHESDPRRLHRRLAAERHQHREPGSDQRLLYRPPPMASPASQPNIAVRRSSVPASRAAAPARAAQSLLTYFAACTFATPPASSAVRRLSRNAFRAPQSRTVGSRRQQRFPHHRRRETPVPQRVLQRSESHQLRTAEPGQQFLGLRHHHDDGPTAPDSVQPETDVPED